MKVKMYLRQAASKVNKADGFLLLFSVVITCRDFEEAFFCGDREEAQDTLHAMSAVWKRFMACSAKEVRRGAEA
eukprot:1667383-Rhodomonas_salina.1